jgi:hypothetical protein
MMMILFGWRTVARNGDLVAYQQNIFTGARR